MNSIVIRYILIPALQRLYQIDYNNIRFEVSERNICARLAHHMENIMREYDRSNNTNYFQHYFADVEHNRMGNGDLKHYESSICNIGNVKITRFNIEGDRMCIEFYDKDGNAYTFRVGILSKEVIVDSVINGAFSRNQII